MNIKLDRRKFIQMLVVSTGAPGVLIGCDGERVDKRADKLSATLSRNDLALRVGKAYEKYIEPKKELSIEKIVKSVLTALNISARELDKIPLSALTVMLHNQIKADFENEHVFNVVGWVLSDIETRVCLLAYLRHKQTQFDA